MEDIRSEIQLWALIFTIAFFHQTLSAQNVTQLSISNNGDIGSSPKELISYENQVVFRIKSGNIVAYNPETKEHFLIENGLTGNPLSTSSKVSGASEILNPILYNNKLYFTALDQDLGPGIYAYDGIDAELVASISITDYDNNINRGRAAVHQGKLYALISPNNNVGLELYIINQSHSIEITEDLNPGPEGTELDNLISFEDRLFFTYTTSDYGTEWWSIENGQKATLFYDIYSGISGSDPELPTVAGGVLYFVANDGIHRRELWKIENGITSLVADITINIYNRPPSLMTTIDDDLYFQISGAIRKIEATTDSITIVHSGVEATEELISMQNNLYFYGVGNLYKYDTELDTVLIMDSISSVKGFMATKDQVVILTDDDRVYSTLGHVGDIIELIPESPISWSSVLYYWSTEDYAFFAPNNRSIGTELWEVGSKRECQLSANIEERKKGVNSSVIANDEFIYFAYDSILWRSDGSKSGTSLFTNLGNNHHSIIPLATWEEDIYVAAYLTPQPSSDQTSALIRINANTGDYIVLETFGYSFFSNTVLQLENYMVLKTSKEVLRIEQGNNTVEQIDTILSSYGRGDYFVWQGDLYHTMYSGPNEGQLHKNGEILFDFRKTVTTYESPKKFIEWNNQLYFLTQSNSAGDVIWRTDSTPQGTQLFSEAFPSNYSSFYPVATSNALYFGYQMGYDRDFIITDGTENGTSFLLSPGSLAQPIGYQDKLIYTGYDDTHGNELWSSQGKAGDAILLKDIMTGSPDSRPLYYAEANDLVYFMASDELHGNELWQTDGTPEHTAMVEDIYPGYRSSDPTPLMEFKGKLIFLAGNNFSNLELFIVSDCEGPLSLSCPNSLCNLLSTVLTSSGEITVDLPHYIPTDEHVILNSSDGFSTDSEFTIMSDATLTIETDGCN